MFQLYSTARVSHGCAQSHVSYIWEAHDVRDIIIMLGVSKKIMKDFPYHVLLIIVLECFIATVYIVVLFVCLNSI